MRLLPRATAMMGVPTFYMRLLQHPDLDREATGHMRLFVSGSAPLLAETHREWQARTGHAILERYGMTETNMNTSNPYDGDRVAGTVGFPLPGVEMRVADPESGTRARDGRDRHDRGEGPERVQGLLAHAREDRGRVPRGRLLHHRRSRQDRRARLRAHRRARQGPDHHRRLQRLSEGGREPRSTPCPAWSRAPSIGVPHRRFRRRRHGRRRRRQEAPGSTRQQILAALEGRLAKFKLPKRVIFVDDLPRNTMGKVQKNMLRDIYGDLYAAKRQVAG